MMQEQNKKAASYLKRNSPSHPWHSHSYPSVRPMDKFVRPPHAYMSASVGDREFSSALSASSSRSSSAKSSPSHACKTKSSKNNKYDYDGGLFTHPKNGNPEYFVIHPDWVSESMTIQKLSLTDRTKVLPKSKSMTWPGRRCNSAPPPKYRNPITWENIITWPIGPIIVNAFNAIFTSLVPLSIWVCICYDDSWHERNTCTVIVLTTTWPIRLFDINALIDVFASTWRKSVT